MIQVSAEERLWQVSEEFLKQSCHIMWTMILTQHNVFATIKVLAELKSRWQVFNLSFKETKICHLHMESTVFRWAQTCLTLFLELLTLKMPRVCRPKFSRCLKQACTSCGMLGSRSPVTSLVDPYDNVSSRPGTLPAIRSVGDTRLSQEPLYNATNNRWQLNRKISLTLYTFMVLDFKTKIRSWTGNWTFDFQISRLALYHLSYPVSIDGTSLNLSLEI